MDTDRTGMELHFSVTQKSSGKKGKRVFAEEFAAPK